jgi:hypothetical protein
VSRGDDGVSIQVKGNEKDPLLTIAAGITYDATINIKSPGTQGSATITVTGGHDQFPAYEIFVNRFEQPNSKSTLVYGYDPRKTGTTGWSLIPGNWNTINPPVTTVIPGQSPPPQQPTQQPRRKHRKNGDD